MIKDIELILGRQIKGLKNTESINIDDCIAMLNNTNMLKNSWYYKENVEIEFTYYSVNKFITETRVINQATIKNGNFTAQIEFTVDNLIMVAKNWRKRKIEVLPEQKQVVKPIEIKLVKKVRKPAPIKRQLQPQKNNFNWSAYICM